jgi:cytochrome c oxidase subunit 2
MSRHRRGLAMVVFITAVLWPARLHLAAQTKERQPSTVTVEVLAERFRFTPNEIRVRSGATVQFRLESDDTDHGFRIVGTDIDRIIPKRGRGAIIVTFTPDHAGRYTFECSKVCGAGHEFMHGVLIVED